MGTINDSHLGTMSKSIRCGTCNHTKNNCQGHNGVLDVRYPYILPQFESFVMNVLKKICFNTDDGGNMCLKVIRDSSKCPYCKQDSYRLVGKNITSYRLLFKKGKGKDEKVLTIADVERIFSSISLSLAKEEFGCDKGLSVFVSRCMIIPS